MSRRDSARPARAAAEQQAARQRGHACRVLCAPAAGLLSRAHRRGRRLEIGVFALFAERWLIRGQWGSVTPRAAAQALGCTPRAAGYAIRRLLDRGLLAPQPGQPHRWQMPPWQAFSGNTSPLPSVSMAQWAIVKAALLAYARGRIKRIEPVLGLVSTLSRSQHQIARPVDGDNLLLILWPEHRSEWRALQNHAEAVGLRVAAPRRGRSPRAWLVSTVAALGERAAATIRRNRARLQQRETLAEAIEQAQIEARPRFSRYQAQRFRQRMAARVA